MQPVIKQIHSCPLCKKTASLEMQKLSEYWYCNSCQLGWIKKIQDTAYQDDYYQSGSFILAKLFFPIETIFYKIREYYAGSSEKNLWIDVGAGDGNFLTKVHAKRKIGVEISASGRKAIEKKSLTAITNQSFLKSTHLNADVISFWHVLEHVNYPWKYISAAKDNLKKSGKIIIAVPNNQSFELKLFGKYWFHLSPRYHIWHFSPRSIKEMLDKEGLHVEKIDYWSVEHHLAGILQSFINKTTNSQDILHKLLKRKQNLQGLNFSQITLLIFWCTIGLPIVIIFWIASSLLQKPGTFVLIASRK